jgi:protein required for attachment to host cells
MHAPPKVRFLIANAQTARIIEPAERGFITLEEIDAKSHHRAKHQRATVHQCGGFSQHGAGETDEHARKRENFAEDLAGRINTSEAAGEFERLALVAPARMLSELRRHLSAACTKRIVTEIDKDLTKVAVHDLSRWLRHPDLA